MLALQVLTYIEGYDQTSGPIHNYATGILTPLKEPETMLNQTVLSNSTAGKWAAMQAEKQPEHGRASTLKE